MIKKNKIKKQKKGNKMKGKKKEMWGSKIEGIDI